MIIFNIVDYFISIFYESTDNNNNLLDYFTNENFKYFVQSLDNNIIINNPLIEGIICGIILGIKSSIMVFVFIWIRASFPRIRFDQLMSFC
jgi:NADH-ubiquinone oxidoreductase chain 1